VLADGADIHAKELRHELLREPDCLILVADFEVIAAGLRGKDQELSVEFRICFFFLEESSSLMLALVSVRPPVTCGKIPFCCPDAKGSRKREWGEVFLATPKEP
jgi:hypothetical protein